MACLKWMYCSSRFSIILLLTSNIRKYSEVKPIKVKVNIQSPISTLFLKKIYTVVLKKKGLITFTSISSLSRLHNFWNNHIECLHFSYIDCDRRGNAIAVYMHAQYLFAVKHADIDLMVTASVILV